ncbi:Telomerase Cajal body protein 1 [Favolaschia claudopus]|uniref:Telomerase Cajal body protein 1 n=1 Tax=Favolaschia claudopus TaxID=2862362 RepID=A0AAW0DNA0_9AGAR
MTDTSMNYAWNPPEFDLSGSPTAPQVLSTLAGSQPAGNFGRSAKWCSDGSIALVHCENREFRTHPVASSEQNSEAANPHPNPKILPQPAAIVDYAWYPTAKPTDPASYCFVASVRETPVKLLDASDGRLRASYRIVDHRERQIAPHSLAFNPSATRLYCGFQDAVEIFDVNRPGEGTRLPTSPSKKSRDGIKGIISALAFSPSYETDMYAAGSLAASSGNILLYSETDGAAPIGFVGGGPAAGVTQLHFNPTRPHILYAAFRRHRTIYSWDLRADVSTPVALFSPPSSTSGSGSEVAETNQKRRFDVDVAGRYLGVGDQEGFVNVFDLSMSPGSEGDHPTTSFAPKLRWKAHNDAIGSVAFHPTQAKVLSVSGSRHFHTEEMESSESSSEEEEGENDDEGGATGSKSRNVRRSAARPFPVPLDSSIKVWNLGGAI